MPQLLVNSLLENTAKSPVRDDSISVPIYVMTLSAILQSLPLFPKIGSHNIPNWFRNKEKRSSLKFLSLLFVTPR